MSSSSEHLYGLSAERSVGGRKAIAGGGLCVITERFTKEEYMKLVYLLISIGAAWYASTCWKEIYPEFKSAKSEKEKWNAFAGIFLVGVTSIVSVIFLIKVLL